MKTKIILMNEGKIECTFYSKILKFKKNQNITIIGINDQYFNYKIKFIQHFFDRFGDFQYTMITAIKI